MSLTAHFSDWRSCPKGWFDPYPNFTLEGDRGYSPDDGSFIFVEDLLDKLQNFRTITQVPAKVNSWYRSPVHNASQPGAVPLSQHTLGKAVDLSTRQRDHAHYLRAAFQAGFTGIGLYHSPRWGQFIHLDTGPPRLWYGDQPSKRHWQPILRSVK